MPCFNLNDIPVMLNWKPLERKGTRPKSLGNMDQVFARYLETGNPLLKSMDAQILNEFLDELHWLEWKKNGTRAQSQ